MTYPNTLIFVDLPSDDPDAAGKFYAEVFGWENDPRPAGAFHRMVPGQNFIGPDGKQSEIGNLHLGINNTSNTRPHPHPDGVAPRQLSTEGRKPRIFILVSDDDSAERIMATALKLGAETLWRNHYWKEFNGFNDAFRDPWGNDIILWSKAGDNPQIPDNFTRE
ncbi:MAG: VOC family protein [Planktomarina sp.]|nr:VOC family protein [Planktomarina sp.]|tara:strand:+ start:1526 stop:2017 length:492 start_codon:yes stop_codon:yes gene_type:complete